MGSNALSIFEKDFNHFFKKKDKKEGCLIVKIVKIKEASKEDNILCT